MDTFALLFAGLAAALHVAIFYMESLAWDGRQARATFGPATAQEVEVTREFAFNQGFYNLFLAIVTVVGIVLVAADRSAAGWSLVLAGVGSMLAAAIVLFVSNVPKRQAAIKQGVLPLVAVAGSVVALVA